MKVKLLSTLILFISHFSFSQIIKGTVISNNYTIPKVEVINVSTKAITISGTNGEFSIAANTNDILVFVSKEHQLKKITITSKTLINEALIVELELKIEELNEVIITNLPATSLLDIPAVEQIKRDEIAAERADKILKPPMIDDLNINKGLDIIRIAGFIAELLNKKKADVKKVIPKTAFATLAKNSFDKKFYIETLKLKPQEIELFLQFCEVDPKSKTIATSDNKLGIMDFLFAKKEEFTKLIPAKE